MAYEAEQFLRAQRIEESRPTNVGDGDDSKSIACRDYKGAMSYDEYRKFIWHSVEVSF